MKIRRVQKGDSKKIYRLIQGIMQREFGPHEAKAYPLDDVLGLPQSYKGGRDNFFVMTEGPDKIIATCGIKEEDKDVGLIRRVFVHSQYRRRGMGEKIVKHTIQFCKRKGYRVLTVRTTNSMGAAIALLYKVGFRERASLNIGQIRILKLTYNCQIKRGKEES